MNFSRREALSLAAAGLLPGIPSRPASFKISYLTDIHLPVDPLIQERASEAIDIASSNADFVLFGGDANLCSVFQKRMETDEVLDLGKWGVLVMPEKISK